MESAGRQQERVDHWLSAISESSPAGENARHDPVHASLRSAVANLEGLQVAPVDWSDFSSKAEQLLVGQSKDLLIAGYFTYGLVQTEGLTGLASGLALMSGMLERYWDDCFPEVGRMRGRVNALSWVVERAARGLNDMQLSDADRAALPVLATEAERFAQVVSSRFEPGALDLDPLQQAVARLAPGGAANGSAAAPPSSDTPVEHAGESASQQDSAAPPGSEPSDDAAQPSAPADRTQARLAEIAKPFVDPIPGGQAAGENARFDPRHAAVRKQIEKLGKPSAGEADWQLVRDEGRALLVEASKDYLIASYFAVANYVVGGVPGLLEGIVAMSSLLEHYWDDGFPQRVRARVNAIDWFVDRVDFVKDVASDTLESSDLPLLSQAGKDLEALVLSRFEDETPNIYGLRETLERIKLSMAKDAEPEPVPQSEPTPAKSASKEERTGSSSAAATSTPPARAAAPLAAPSVAALDPNDVDAFLAGIGDAMLDASKQLFQASPENPLPYRLSRLGLYLRVTRLPPTQDGNRTFVPPPSFGGADDLRGLLDSQDWGKLLTESEPGLQGARFWLDLHRYAALALGGLGHEEARDAVVLETTTMVRRLPGLLELEFNDGRPFASVETQEWLAAAAPAGGGAAASATPSGPSDNEGADDFTQKLREAHRIARGGNLQEAIDMLKDAVASGALGGRDRFRAKLAMAGACSAARAHALAEGILAGLDAEIQRFQVENWEPKLAEACYRARYEALTAIGSDNSRSQEELQHVYRQLCKVAPAVALSLKEPGTRG